MPRYSEKQKAALDTLMKDDVYRQAMEIITAEGLQGLTMDRLARAVGVSRGTLYNYFADRDAVVDYVEERTFAPLLENLDEIADGPLPPAEKMEAMAREVLTGVYENRSLVVALTPEKHSGAHGKCKLERRERGLRPVERVVCQGIEAGSFRDLPSDAVAEIFFCTITGLIDHMVFGGEFRKPEEVVPTLMEMILGGLRSK